MFGCWRKNRPMLLDDYYFNFGPGKLNGKKDFKILSSSSEIGKEYDVLIFNDSKGVSLQNVKSWPEMLIEYFKEKGISSLFISRPRELTVFFTLINFIKLNGVQFKYLITNVGFVETTPKKEEFIDDIISQCPILNTNLRKYPLCDYPLNTGKIATLYSIDYESVISLIANSLHANFKQTHLIGAYEFTSGIKIQRNRPKEFYNQLKMANKLMRTVCGLSDNIEFVDVNCQIPQNQEDLSYDAMHFTQEGHNNMLDFCLNLLDI